MRYLKIAMRSEPHIIAWEPDKITLQMRHFNCIYVDEQFYILNQIQLNVM